MDSILGAWAVCASLIFGGCCSNVYALESIIKQEPGSGLLITFVQFVVTALFTWPAHFDASRPPFYLKPMEIPLIAWMPNITMFFTVNLLNNMAFGYNISVPVHIILRSGGSVLTMLVGFIWGKRYTNTQIMSVVMLTIGVIIAAMADANSKGKLSASATSISFDLEILTGLFLLFVAQLLSAIMGLYVQLTYARYGSHWLENLFYSHLLSLPLFSPFGPGLWTQSQKLLSYPPVLLVQSPANSTNSTSISMTTLHFPRGVSKALPLTYSISPYIVALAINALSQYACIRGVNMLAARTSAIGVTIMLNVRKLVSLFISIHLFGNRLPPGVLVGAAIVFSSAGIWAWESQRVRNKEKGMHEEKKKQ